MWSTEIRCELELSAAPEFDVPDEAEVDSDDEGLEAVTTEGGAAMSEELLEEAAWGLRADGRPKHREDDDDDVDAAYDDDYGDDLDDDADADFDTDEHDDFDDDFDEYDEEDEEGL